MCLDIHFLAEEGGGVEEGVDEEFLFFLFGGGLSLLLLKSDGIGRGSDRPQVMAPFVFLVGFSPEDPFDDSDQFGAQRSFGGINAVAK